ncbi:hypothetical protein [Pedobacter cryophilus]|uniref:Uncharacterized protein n=1 Tax=Pedobacter cryophilus TaxID=2571271 RepID=A0A4U1BW91_9SPHI|nr:hypothetical protein [Pedobacter cryophilus]TKB96858.1 hypothetical protein FA046_12330 [Pedobacter cryophilus]
MENQKTATKEPKKVEIIFGKEYCFQGSLTGSELETVKNNWKNAGHSVMMKPKNSNNLYVSRFKTRNY